MGRTFGLRLATIAGLAAGALGLALAAGAARAADAEPIYSATVGKTIYATYCANCHGFDLRGKGEIAATLSDKPTDLTRAHREEQWRLPQGAPH